MNGEIINFTEIIRRVAIGAIVGLALVAGVVLIASALHRR